ncbi:hypothetical protein BpHYR1_002900 [Brachionus plicatilis]|uniref:Uncharacterized protein n=1 Tax=Brachionus plicatilis TaxID=10195 RepID=A0A3M7QB76_BRAPC|nr:hypothetical protein BpHYR1_002900 [Brachionus plicatilis]
MDHNPINYSFNLTLKCGFLKTSLDQHLNNFKKYIAYQFDQVISNFSLSNCYAIVEISQVLIIFDWYHCCLNYYCFEYILRNSRKTCTRDLLFVKRVAINLLIEENLYTSLIDWYFGLLFNKLGTNFHSKHNKKKDLLKNILYFCVMLSDLRFEIIHLILIIESYDNYEILNSKQRGIFKRTWVKQNLRDYY